ncbi:MAG: hypothetical protein RSD62_05745, partial [Ruthenibacterium sp.]
DEFWVKRRMHGVFKHALGDTSLFFVCPGGMLRLCRKQAREEKRRQTKTGRKNEQFTKFLDPIAGRFYMPAIDDAQEQCEITLL